MKKSQLKKLEAHSKELDKEFSGSIESTKPLSTRDREWLKDILKKSDERKIPVTIRLNQWQVEQAKKLAAKMHLRGYQTLIRQILSEALIAQH